MRRCVPRRGFGYVGLALCSCGTGLGLGWEYWPTPYMMGAFHDHRLLQLSWALEYWDGGRLLRCE